MNWVHTHPEVSMRQRIYVEVEQVIFLIVREWEKKIKFQSNNMCKCAMEKSSNQSIECPHFIVVLRCIFFCWLFFFVLRHYFHIECLTWERES